MNELITAQQESTMSSIEIATLTKKNHSDVKRDIVNVLSQADIDASKFAGIYKDNMNRDQQYFNLPRRECDLVVSGYSVKYRLAIIDRWRELEFKQTPTPPAFQIPQTLAEALQLAADQAKQLELQAPKVAFVEKLVERENLLNATQVAQPHKLSAVKLNRILDDVGGIYNKSVKRGRAFCQAWIDGGYGELKVTESGHNQCLFTVKGEQRINDILISEGIV